jgi:5-methylcytosine-specific restriction endonuclease McrA
MSDKYKNREELYLERLILRQEGEEILQDVKQVLTKTATINNPRQQFNNWLKSKEGQAWKQKEFKKRNGICAYCGEKMREQDIDVHHVQPISQYGHSANTISNYRLLHPSCNSKIQTQVVDLLF